VRVTEAACFAGAMLAFSALNSQHITPVVKNWVKTGDVIEPISENAGVYSRRFETYIKLYPSLKNIRW
jgi:sugar (pentulose or hexulose) kinase